MIRQADILARIPYFPKACSALMLAYSLGMVRDGDGQERVARQMSRLERRLAWLTLADDRLFERIAPLQRSTSAFLEEHRITYPGSHLAYLSLRGTGEEEEE